MKRILVSLLLAIASAPALAQWGPVAWGAVGVGGGAGDVEAVNITASSPLTGGANCASGTCAFTLGLTFPFAIYTTDQLLTAAQDRGYFSNAGASGAVVLTLPTNPAAGLQYSAIVETGLMFYLKAGAGATIRRTTAVDACVYAPSIGNVMTVTATSTTTWVATSYVGSWTVGACP